jgi:uncharacterized ferritin-like protein (DUF455 family)
MPTSYERILLGATLQDKLSPILLEPSPQGFPLPRAPGRPPELALRQERRGKLPRPGGLLDARSRGRVLHAFVNHELLALELFALALLRFPDAPPALRIGWRHAAADEQRHLAEYLHRMVECGVQLGDEPVSAFFWDALHEAADPVSFTLGMALVLEQANLDFTRGWREAFARAGDLQTAEVLDRVYEDEIRHVRIGAACLRRVSGTEPLFATLQARLRFPLQPARARARGFPFDREGRLRAGLDPDLIDTLQTTGGSVGRDPLVYWFDPFTEDELAGRPIARPELAADLATLPMFLAGLDDVVLAPPPRPTFLRSLAQAGFPLPQFLESPDPAQLPGHRAAGVRPWAYGPRAARALAPFGLRDDPRVHALYDKRFLWAHQRAWTEGLGLPLQRADDGVPCATLQEVQAACGGEGDWVIKAPLSASGGHRLRARAPLDDKATAWVDRTLRSDGAVIVEPWLPVVAELSVQAEVAQGRVHIVGLTRFGAVGGSYRGTVIGDAALGCDPAFKRLLRGELAVEDRLGTVASRAGQALLQRGHQGPFGLDVLVVDGPSLRIRLGELNPRTTMGRVALGLRRRLAPGTVGVHLLLPVRILTPSLLEHLAQRWPVTRQDHKMAQGFLPTTDPQAARALQAALGVGRSWEEVTDTLQQAAAAHPDGERLMQSLRWLAAEVRGPACPPGPART